MGNMAMEFLRSVKLSLIGICLSLRIGHLAKITEEKHF